MKRDTIIQSTGFKVTAMILFIGTTAFVLNRFAQLVSHIISIDYNWQFELMMITGMLFFQFPFIMKKTAKQKLDYYYNMLLVSFMGSVLLLPLLLLNRFGTYSDLFNIIYFFAVVLWMFFDHKRRVFKLRLPLMISYTWVLYRIIILFFIIKVHE